MNNSSIAELLGIDKGFKLKERKDLGKEGEMYFEVGYTERIGIPRCPYHCEGCKDKYQVVRNGKGKEKCIKAGKVGTKEVYLIHRPQRYLCKRTRKSFSDERISYRWKRVTRAKMKDILEDIGNMSISMTAKTHKVSINTVNGLLDSIEIRADWSRFADRDDIKLGIDEHSFRGHRMVTTVVELNTSTPIAILKSDKKEVVKGYLRSIPDEIKGKISEIAIDMRESFKNAIEEELLGMEIVADHFHVIAHAQKKLREMAKVEEEVANEERKKKIRIPVRLLFVNGEKLVKSKKKMKKLRKVLKEYPCLREYYGYLVILKWVYKAPTRKEGARRLNILVSMMEKSEDPEVRKWSKTYIRWREKILQYFVNKTTTAKVEGHHTHIKLIKRMSFGFRTVERYIKKILLGVMPKEFIKLPNFVREGTTYCSCKGLSFAT